jgi:hypothetical protein
MTEKKQPQDLFMNGDSWGDRVPFLWCTDKILKYLDEHGCRRGSFGFY